LRKLRIAVLMHAALVPPKSIEGLSDEVIDLFKMEYDVCAALHNLGHEVVHVPVEDDLAPIRRVLRERRPHIAFNLLMHFHDAGIYDSAVVSWLELNKQHYSGCNPRGLFVANDKALCKKVFAYHRIRAPRFFVVGRGKKAKGLPKGLRWPLFVKSRSEHSSTGISQGSIVHDLDQLQARVKYVHDNVGTAALCEEYIVGRELTVGILGNKRVEVSPMEDLDESKIAEIQRTARRIHRAVGLSGYSRIDMRLDAEGRVWILEANPNPDLCFGEDFAESFRRLGYSYPELLQKILNLGLRYEAPWMG